MITITVAEQFSRYPAGRFFKDGPYSGEYFRTKYLVPAFSDVNNEKVVINLDGARGYGSSFLEEAFGGLIRIGLNKDDIKAKIEINAKDISLKEEILEYIDKALPSA